MSRPPSGYPIAPNVLVPSGHRIISEEDYDYLRAKDRNFERLRHPYARICSPFLVSSADQFQKCFNKGSGKNDCYLRGLGYAVKRECCSGFSTLCGLFQTNVESFMSRYVQSSSYLQSRIASHQKKGHM